MLQKYKPSSSGFHASHLPSYSCNFSWFKLTLLSNPLALSTSDWLRFIICLAVIGMVRNSRCVTDKYWQSLLKHYGEWNGCFQPVFLNVSIYWMHLNQQENDVTADKSSLWRNLAEAGRGNYSSCYFRFTSFLRTVWLLSQIMKTVNVIKCSVVVFNKANK